MLLGLQICKCFLYLEPMREVQSDLRTFQNSRMISLEGPKFFRGLLLGMGVGLFYLGGVVPGYSSGRLRDFKTRHRFESRLNPMNP